MLQYNCCITFYLQKVGVSYDASAFLDPVHDPAALDLIDRTRSIYRIYSNNTVNSVFHSNNNDYGNYRINAHNVRKDGDIT